jgi:hypothetical protein
VVAEGVARVPDARRFAVEDEVSRRKLGNRGHERRIGIVLRQAVSRKQPHVRALFEREQPDTVQLALEHPLGAREPLASQRGRHRLEPGRKARAHDTSLAPGALHALDLNQDPIVDVPLTDDDVSCEPKF